MNNETKQTAVEWYNQQIVDRQNGNGDSRSFDEIFEQAKEMEKEQQKNTWEDSRLEDKGDNYIGKQKSFEDYYNKTYGGNKLIELCKK
jgi:hypothetical protein